MARAKCEERSSNLIDSLLLASLAMASGLNLLDQTTLCNARKMQRQEKPPLVYGVLGLPAKLGR
jgi:hypothetical protein